MRHSPKTLVLGLGNDLLRDDGIGLRLAAKLAEWPDLPPNMTVSATTEMGLSLLDHIAGFQRIVLIDSIQTSQVPTGHIHSIQTDDLSTLPLVSPHFLGVGEVLALGRKLGMEIADNVRVIAIEVADPFTVSPNLSPELEALFPSVLAQVKSLLSPVIGAA